MRHLLFLHLLGASVWVGGHLVLLLGILPRAMLARDPAPIRAFEQIYERIGVPALLLQIVSGLWLAVIWLPPAQWLDQGALPRLVQTKLLLLALTLGLGLHARLVLIPHLDQRSLPRLGLHILFITLAAVAFVWTGTGFRVGALF